MARTSDTTDTVLGCFIVFLIACGVAATLAILIVCIHFIGKAW